MGTRKSTTTTKSTTSKTAPSTDPVVEKSAGAGAKTKVTTPATLKQSTPSITEVHFGGKAHGKIGSMKGGFRFFGDPENRKFPTIEEAANELLSHKKVDVTGTGSTTTKTTTEKTATEGAATAKADPKAEFEAKAKEWLTANLSEKAETYLPEFVKVLLSLRTRKKFLKDIEDIELVQAMYDFEADVPKRSRQLKHLLSKISGLARRGGVNKKLTMAHQFGNLLSSGTVSGFEVAPDGEQPKQLTVMIALGDGVYTVKLTVREIDAVFPEEEIEEEEDDNDSDDSSEVAEVVQTPVETAPESTEELVTEYVVTEEL